jgi:endonuclease/exonuclease/phosphatase (EEP) superfamily protein YafD
MAIILKTLFWVVVAFLFFSSVLPFSKIAHGAVRGLAFPREQFFVLTVGMVVVTLLFVNNPSRLYALGILAVVMVVHLGYIIKFTPIWPTQSVEASEAELADTESHVKIIAANVKQSNREFGKLIDLIREEQPEIATALEVDEEWVEALYAGLKDDYPHWVKVAKDNSYGMVMMSKLSLSETQVRELLVKDVPSIKTTVRNADGQQWRLYIVHPEPPVPYHNTKGRDGEIALVGIEASEDSLPAIVTGDLNDVAWSTTTRRFQRLSGLLDPRVGRGFYNTFHAGVPFARWPLDHLFHDPEFCLIQMSRLRNIDSDHFPIMFSLALTKTEKANSTPETSDADERDEVREIVEDEKKDDREAIGTDWEKDEGS